MVLDNTQIMVLHWFYKCNENKEKASYKGTIEHFGRVLKINDPMNVIMSLLNMGLIRINKSKLEVSITKEGIQEYKNLQKKGKKD